MKGYCLGSLLFRKRVGLKLYGCVRFTHANQPQPGPLMLQETTPEDIISMDLPTGIWMGMVG